MHAKGGYAKGYESIMLVFLEQGLISLNFPDGFVKWVYDLCDCCLYGIVVNGMLTTFPAKRGLR